MTIATTIENEFPEIAEAPRYSCSLAGVMGTVLGIFGGVPILHSGAGCGLGNQFGLTYASGENAGGPQGGTNTPCTCLVEEHVIFGGEEKLKDLIESTIELMHGDFFTVISGCVPSLVGDDVGSVVKQFSSKVPIVSVDAPGFGGNSYLGYELFFKAVIDQLLTKKPRQTGLVNIFGVVPYQHLFWKGDLAVIKQLFAKAGLEANIIFTEFAGLENLQKIPAAQLNLVLSPWNGHGIAETLQERFGTPFVSFPGVPVGPKETSRLLELVARALGAAEEPVARVIAAEERHAYRFTEYLGDGLILGLPHAYFAVAADSGTAIQVTKYLANEVAYIPDIVILTDNPPEASRAGIIRELTDGLETSLKPEVVFEIDAHLIREKLKGRNFLFLLSSSLEKNIAGEEYGAMHHSIAFPSYDRLVLDRSYAGYRGGLALMEELTSKWVGPL